MKLPARVSTSVQPLAQISPSAVASAKMAMGDASFSVANAVAQIRQTKINAELRDAGLYMANKMTEFEQQYAGKEYLEPGEIPSGVEYKRVSKDVDASGNLVESERTAVPAYEVLPDVYKSFAKTHAQAAADLISDERERNRWLQDSNLTVDEQYVGRLSNARQKQLDFIEKKTASEVSRAVDAGNYELARELTQGLQNAELSTALNSEITKREFVDPLNDLILDPDATPEEIALTINTLSDPEFSGPISDAERAAKVSALRSSYDRSIAVELERQERERQLIVSDTWLAIDAHSPQVDEYYINGLFDTKKIDGGTRTAMMRALDQARFGLVEQKLFDIDLDRIAAAGYGIDPKDKDMRAAVDRRFDRYVDNTDDVWGAAERVMKEFKVVPSRVIGMFRSANRAEAPELAKSVQLFMQAQDYAPKSLADFKEGEVEFIENVSANVRLGMDVPSAVEATNAYNSMTPQQKETLNRESKLMTENNGAALEDRISNHPSYDKPWNPFNPKPNSFMMNEYDALVKRILPSVGYNVSVAQNKAFSALTKSWSLTDVNGDWELMKNMPQAPAEDIRAQLHEYTPNLNELSTFHGKQFKKSDIKIYSDALTQVELNNGTQPSYSAYVVVDRDNGVIEQLPRFKFDAEKAKKLRKEKAIEDAKARRARQIEATEVVLNRPSRGSLL